MMCWMSRQVRHGRTCSISATMPAARGAAADVPVCPSVQPVPCWSDQSEVTYTQTHTYPTLGFENTRITAKNQYTHHSAVKFSIIIDQELSIILRYYYYYYCHYCTLGQAGLGIFSLSFILSLLGMGCFMKTQNLLPSHLILKLKAGINPEWCSDFESETKRIRGNKAVIG